MASLGLPGTANFVAEFTIFIGAVKVFLIPAILGIFGIIFTAVYTLRVLANVLFGPRRPEWDYLKDLRGPEMVPLILLAFILIAAGVMPNVLMDLINSGVHSSGIADVIQALGPVNGGIF
jgi:NADH-quinone oxidoreductase subunit M